MAVLTLVGCSGSDAQPANGNDHRFHLVATSEPTADATWVVDANDPMTLYALGRRSLRSRDGGRTWAELDWPAGAQALHFSRSPARALYLEVQPSSEDFSRNVYKSHDEGKHWSLVSHGYSFTTVDQDAGTMLLRVIDESRVLRSVDDGATWTDVALPDSLTKLDSVPLVAPDSTLYIAALGFDADALAFRSIVLVSTDGGASFTAKQAPASRWVNFTPQLSLDCQGRLYVLTDNTLYRSSDGGNTWQSVLEMDPSVIAFRAIQSAPSVCSDAVYASGPLNTGALQLFTLDGAGNLAMQALPNSGAISDLGNERLLLVPSFGPPQRSDDHGRSWWTPGVTLGLGDLSLSLAQPGLLFSSTGAAVYRSEDGGTNWVPGAVRAKGNPAGLYPDPYDANVVYASSVYGTDSPWSFISTDRGASFQDWPVPSREKPESPEVMVSTAPGAATVVTQKGVYTTDDAGAHFSPLLVLSGEEEVLAAAVSASQPPAIYVYLYGLNPQAHEIRVSTDGGANWLSGDLGTHVDQLIAHPSDGNVAFAVAGSGGPSTHLLRTSNAGQTWEYLALPGDESWVRLRVDPLPPHALYAVGKHLSRSDDHGSSWRILADTPELRGDFEIAPHPGGRRYFLAEDGSLFDFVE